MDSESGVIFETELPVPNGAVYYILNASRSVSIWDGKKGNNTDNENEGRGEGKKIFLNTKWYSRDHDRWHISGIVDKPGVYKIENYSCKKYASIPVASKENQEVKLYTKEFPWEIRKNYEADRGDEFFIVSSTNQQLCWFFSKLNTDLSMELRLGYDPVPWKLVRYNPNSTTDENPQEEAQNSAREPRVSFGIDIGAAYTSVSFSDPEGNTQQLKEWSTKFSDGEKVSDASVPTRMYYHKEHRDSEPYYCGSGEPPEPQDYNEVVQFKSDMSRLSTLSKNAKKQLSKHYTDWLGYLFNNAKHLSVDWPQHWERRQVVIVVPNTWDYDQRILLKSAISQARWVEKETNIKFIRECEATLHCLVKSKEAWKSQEVGKAFVVVDAGHINFDVALFYVKSKSPPQFREKAGKSPETFFKGGIQRRNLNIRAENAESPQRRLVEKVIQIKKNEKNNLEYLYLAGDPSQNESLLAELKKISGLTIVPIGWQNAADGALHNSTVVAHAVPRSYGVEAMVSSDEPKGDMEGRTPVSCPNGEFFQFGWNPIIKYEMVLEGRTEKREEFSLIFESKDADLLKFDITVFAAERHADNYWVRDSQGNLNRGFTALFVVKADLSEMVDKLREVWDGYSDEPYYQLDFEVELVFDKINLKGNVIHKGRKMGRATFELV